MLFYLNKSDIIYNAYFHCFKMCPFRIRYDRNNVLQIGVLKQSTNILWISKCLKIIKKFIGKLTIILTIAQIFSSISCHLSCQWCHTGYAGSSLNTSEGLQFIFPLQQWPTPQGFVFSALAQFSSTDTTRHTHTPFHLISSLWFSC